MMNILVTSAGGPAGYGVIKSLKHMNFDGKIVPIDVNELSVGCQMAPDYCYQVCRADRLGFFNDLYMIIEDEKIDLILPTGPEIEPISRCVETIESMGAKVFMSGHDSIQLCNDKFSFYEKCKDDFILPKTTTNIIDAFLSNKFEGKVFAKPRFELGGSRGAMLCESYNQAIVLERDKEYIYQKYLPGQEYTIDVLCDMDSNPLVVIPRKRIETKAGISTKGEIIKDDYIEKVCADMCKFLKLKGPICLQMKEDENGIPTFVEVNPRFGGGTYFTTLAGVNFVQIILDIIEGKVLNIPEPKLITILRYFEEIVV